MDSKGRYTDNLFIERLWRSLKYEEVYLKAYTGGREARVGIGSYLDFYNMERPHQALSYRSPAEVFMNANHEASPADLVELWKPSTSAEPTLAVGPDLNTPFHLFNCWGPPQLFTAGRAILGHTRHMIGDSCSRSVVCPNFPP